MAVRRKSGPARRGGTAKKPPRRAAARPRRAAKPAARRAARPAARRAQAPKPRITRPSRKPAARRRAAKRTAPAPVAGSIGLVLQHMDYTTHAMDEVRRFYTELLGFTRSHFDPRVDYLMVRTGPSSSLGFMPPMEGPPGQWRPPREPAIYLFIRDVDRAHANLTAKGVEFVQPPMDTSWGARVAILKDPEGRTVCLAHSVRR